MAINSPVSNTVPDLFQSTKPEAQHFYLFFFIFSQDILETTWEPTADNKLSVDHGMKNPG